MGVFTLINGRGTKRRGYSVTRAGPRGLDWKDKSRDKIKQKKVMSKFFFNAHHLKR